MLFRSPARRLRRPCSCRAVPTNEALEFLQHVAHGSAGERDGMLGGQEVTFERCADQVDDRSGLLQRSEEHTSELQSLMRISYAVFCLKKKKKNSKKSPENNETTE